MKITLKRTEEQVELVKAMASKNRDVAYEAQVALAEFIGPVLAKVINQAPTLSNLFSNFQFSADESPSIPMDLYYDITDEDYVTVWSQAVPGGLPTNTVTPIGGEMKFTTYRLDSAVDFDKRYAQRSRMDVISKSFTRVAQEVLLKQERNSATLMLGALAEASTKGRNHVIKSGNAGRLILDDFNKLLTLGKRINTAWTGGTPEGGIGGRGVTDLIVSPEVVQGLREMAYNPINTNANAVTDITATDSMREAIYNNGGIPEFYGINIMELQEMGKGQRFNKLFATLVDGQTNDIGHAGDNSFGDGGAGGDSEIVIGLDKRVESMLRAVATDSETGSEFSLVADDQYSVRQSKIGYYGSVEEGRMILDNRALFGIVV
tara:strand:+ start:3578 stop:4705 length:1128 start_codon:yes stop_codon:yes gene_type:complete